MLERQSRVPQEGEGQRRSATDAGEARAQRPAEREDVDRAEVGKFATFDVAPDLLDRIQFWGVAGQGLAREQRPGAREILPHHAALVPTQPVPDQDDVAPREVPLERAQESDQREIVVTPGPRLEVTAPAPAVPAEGQGRRDRQARPAPASMGQDRRGAARGPRGAGGRPARGAAFLFREDPGPPPPGRLPSTPCGLRPARGDTNGGRPPASRPACGRRSPAIRRARTNARPRIDALPMQQNPDGIRGWLVACPSIAGYSMNLVNLFHETH